jgi:hypothetical protein
MAKRQYSESKFGNDVVITTTDQAECIELDKRTFFVAIESGYSGNEVFDDHF